MISIYNNDISDINDTNNTPQNNELITLLDNDDYDKFKLLNKDIYDKINDTYTIFEYMFYMNNTNCYIFRFFAVNA